MGYKILYKSSVSRDLRQLGAGAPERILREIKGTLAAYPNAGDPLKEGFKGLYKLRVGEYRAIYSKIEGKNTLLILRIRHRSKAYS